MSLAKDLLLLNKNGQQASVFLIPNGIKKPSDFLKSIVLDYIESKNGINDVLATANDYNWNDAFNGIPNSFWNKHGVSFFDGTEVLLSGHVIETRVNINEILLESNRHIVVKDFGTLSIVKQFANEEDGVYGDIYSQEWHARSEHQGETILSGFGILDKETGYILDSARDWYDTLEDAEDDLPEGSKEVIDFTKLSGKALFDLVFPKPESPERQDFETEMDYERQAERNWDVYQENISTYGIEEHPELTDFKELDKTSEGWWSYQPLRFKKGEYVYEIVRKTHNSPQSADSELLYDTFKIIR